jgi:quinohemoprotein ethanol dehydrogenase
MGLQQNHRIDENALKNGGKTGEEWLTYGLNYAETRYSPLKQIDTTNVKRLGLAWTYEITQAGNSGQEATPLVANGVLYSVTNWSITYALDARTGRERWRYDPKVDRPRVQPRICCGIVNRGLAIYENKIFVPVIDGRLVALDAANGTEIWSVQTVPVDQPYTMTVAPRIAKNKVIVGNSGADKLVRGYFSAYNVDTGKLEWRFYTVPGDPSKRFENKAMEMAAKTWSGDWWKLGGGGTVWDAITYDPDTNLMFVGTGNSASFPAEFRKSKGLDNLFTASVIAVDADKGEYRWHYQFVPGDSWDFDGVQQLTLADIRINGRTRKVIMQANKNGFFYVIDRTNGRVISAEPFAQVNWASGIDLKTGRPMIRPEAQYGKDQKITIMPGAYGAHNWAPMSFNPNTGLMYIPTVGASSQEYYVDPTANNAGLTEAPAGVAPNAGAAARSRQGVPPPGPTLPSIGPKYEGPWLVAWDVVAQKEKWRARGGGTAGGGTLTTASNLVFQTTAQFGADIVQFPPRERERSGRLRAFSADKGDLLLDIPLGQAPVGPPITFMLDGKQYVAVAGGRNPALGSREDATPGNKPILPMLYVYVLDGNAPNPTLPAGAQ